MLHSGQRLLPDHLFDRVGIQFDAEEGQLIRARIETYLAGYEGSAQPTQTF